MDSNQNTIDFDDIANLLVEKGLDCSPSEIHGCITGQWVSGLNVPAEQFLAGVTQALDIDIHGGLAIAVIQLSKQVGEQLKDDEFSFQPLIPDDDMELSQRVQSLGLWCQGILAGFASGVSHSGNSDALSVEVSETLSDISEISRAGVDESEDLDQSEQSLFEVLEYVRLAAMSIYMEYAQEAFDEVEEPEQIGSPAGLFGKKLH